MFFMGNFRKIKKTPALQPIPIHVIVCAVHTLSTAFNDMIRIDNQYEGNIMYGTTWNIV